MKSPRVATGAMLVIAAISCGRTQPGDLGLDEVAPPATRSTGSATAATVSSGPTSSQATTPTTSLATGPTLMSTRSMSSQSASSASTGVDLTANQIYHGDSSIDGAIATDGDHVYWVMQNPQTGALDLMFCPVTGCPGNSPAVFHPGVNWGDGVGELAIADGLIYFQLGGMPTPVVDCPLAGCGGAPTHFADVGTTAGFSAALATDGTRLYWADDVAIHSCGVGATCAQPFTVTSLAPEQSPVTLVVSGANLYWVNEAAPTVETAPIAGGAISTVCTLNPTGMSAASTVAVVGGFAYVAGAWGGSIVPGIQRCALSGGGASTVYLADPGAENIATDGVYLYWITGGSAVLGCAAGAVCAAPTTLPGPGNVIGFVPSGGYAYWATLAVGRVPLP